MLRITILSIAALVTGCAVPPPGTSPEMLTDYDIAVASIGCTLRGESDYTAVEFQTGMTREQVLQLTQFRLANGQAEKPESGGVRLTSGSCATA